MAGIPKCCSCIFSLCCMLLGKSHGVLILTKVYLHLWFRVSTQCVICPTSFLGVYILSMSDRRGDCSNYWRLRKYRMSYACMKNFENMFAREDRPTRKFSFARKLRISHKAYSRTTCLPHASRRETEESVGNSRYSTRRTSAVRSLPSPLFAAGR